MSFVSSFQRMSLMMLKQALTAAHAAASRALADVALHAREEGGGENGEVEVTAAAKKGEWWEVIVLELLECISRGAPRAATTVCHPGRLLSL